MLTDVTNMVQSSPIQSNELRRVQRWQTTMFVEYRQNWRQKWPIHTSQPPMSLSSTWVCISIDYIVNC